MESSGGGRDDERSRGDERSSAFDFDLNVELEFDRLGREPEREPLGGELGPPPFVSETPAEGAPPVQPRSPRRAQPAPRPNRKPRSARSETLARILWAIPWIVVAVTIVAVGGLPFAGAMVVFAFIGLSELFRMTREDSPLLIVAFLASAGMIVAAYYGSSFQIVLAGVAAFPLMFLVAASRGSLDGVTRSMAITAFGVLWIGLPFAHAVLLRELPLHGGALLIDVLVATFVADTSAYAVGRLIGRHKLAPDISPNKTMEGMIGGFIGGTMGFWFAGLYQDWLPGLDALLMGMVIAILAPMGDLFESMIKRDLGVKDSGHVFGPHGGLLDRLDAVLFTVVAGYYLSVAFVY
jgi:phosphatidate cytidylyltransferase